MKHIIFAILLVLGLVIISGVALQPAQVVAQGDSAARLRDAWSDMSFFKSSYRFERLDLLKRVVEKISNDYVDDSRIELPEMLDTSLDFVGRRVPEVMFDYAPGDPVIHGTVGSVGREITVGKLTNIRDLTRVLEEVAEFLAAEVPEDTELPQVEYAMINGLLSTLDPHSVFINPKAYEEMSISNEGAFGGLGITIGIRKQRLTILYPLPDTPAAEAGLLKQDRIVRIGGESTVNMTLEEAVERLRGDPGTPITITIERESDGELRTLEVTLIRQLIRVRSVKGRYLGDGVGGIQIIHFSQDTFSEMDRLITEMDRTAVDEGRDGLEGLVIDLRDNPGGYLNQAIQVSDKFLESGVIVSTRGNARQQGEYHEARKLETESDMRLVMLVDYGSASASEIFAGAVRNLDRGVVVGVTTFGKGSVQNLYPFHHDGSALKLTIDHYLTPGDQSIQSVGIDPDIELRPVWIDDDGDAFYYWQDAMVREKDLDEHFDGGEIGEGTGYAYQYLAPDFPMWSQEDFRDEPDDDMARWGEGFQVQFAKTIVTESTRPERKRMLTESYPAIQEAMREHNADLVARFAEVGIDWSPPPAEGAGEGTPRAVIEMQVGSATGVLPVGEKTPLTLTVTNAGDAPFHRLRAMADSELIGGKEFMFGRVAPGETRTWTVHLEPGLRMSSRTDEVTFEFFADGSRAPGDFAGKLMIEEKPRPRFAYNFQVIDDGSGDSKGNGDGLVQPGEAIDLLVTVQNIGDGPTGDQVSTVETTAELHPMVAPPGTPATDPFLDAPEDPPTGMPIAGTRDGEDAAAGDDPEEEEPRSSGFIRLSNESGKDVFLTEGSAEFSLAPGEMTRARLHFDVSDELLGDALEMTVVIGDDEFWEFFEDDLEFPLAYTVAGEPPAASVPTLSKVMRTRGMIEVRSGAAADAPRIATADGAVQADGKLASWVRVALPWGGHGWIDSDDLKGGGGVTPSDEAFLPWISRSPPVVLLSSRIGGTAVDAETVQLSGVVRDDQAVKDLFIFVNGTKVFYRSVTDAEGTTGEGSVDFEFAVGLEEGDNTIEVFARDNDDLMGSTTIGVYRTQSAETAMQ
jgi:putative carboxyl-terminal-processing protease